MKPTSSHDSFDDLIAAALHGELTPEERTRFETRLQTDPAALAAYQETQLMHDLLEKTHREAQPDPDFEQRVISGVRRKIQHEKEHRETPWESLLILWRWLSGLLLMKRRPKWQDLAYVFGIIAVLSCVVLTGVSSSSNAARRASAFAALSSDLKQAQRVDNLGTIDYGKPIRSDAQSPGPEGNVRRNETVKGVAQLQDESGRVDLKWNETPRNTNAVSIVTKHSPPKDIEKTFGDITTLEKKEAALRQGFERGGLVAATTSPATPSMPSPIDAPSSSIDRLTGDKLSAQLAINSPSVDSAPAQTPEKPKSTTNDGSSWSSAGGEATTGSNIDANRKLIRNADLDLEVKSFQTAIDQIAALTKAAGGYIDSSNSQRGGNGKLQGTVVAKVLPQNLDAFLLKLRDLGELKNQTLKAEDVTKAYYDTQARLENARRMETQLQDLLKHENSKVSDLLQVERELGRVRGEIEQMQGELKLYDFQVQYATVTMNISEKDLNQAAAYMLKEQDNFSLFATNVEETFQQVRHAAEDVKGQVLQANLNHNSGSNVSADFDVMVAPEQIEAFLSQIRTLGRVENFTRQTQRVAKDGGDSDQPADQALTEKDKVQVHLSICSDDESRKQVALTVVASAVDTALEKAKAAALAAPGTEILGSSLNKTPQGESTGALSVRVPGKSFQALLDTFRALGRTSSFSLQRNDNSGPGATGDDEPVIVTLSLTDSDAPLQQTEMSVLTRGVDEKSQQIKKEAAAAGVEIKASGYQRMPNGLETADLTFRLPMSKYAAFVETLTKLGKVEVLTVHREDRPDRARADDAAPAEINLRLHSQGDIVTEEHGLWATLRQMFGEGAGALFGSVRTIGVIAAFLLPWAIVLVLVAWVGRRLYIRNRK